MKTFETQLTNHFSHARLLNSQQLRLTVVQKIAWYSHIMFFVMGLGPLLRYIFSTSHLSGGQLLLGVGCWFTLMGGTILGWEKWKRHALRPYNSDTSKRDQLKNNGKQMNDEEYTAHVCELFAQFPQYEQFGEELWKLQRKNKTPLLWWDGLNDMLIAENQRNFPDVLVDHSERAEQSKPTAYKIKV